MGELTTDDRDFFQAQVDAENKRLTREIGTDAEPILAEDPSFASHVTRQAFEHAGARLEPNLKGRERFGFVMAKRTQRWWMYRLAALTDMSHDLPEDEMEKKMLVQDDLEDRLEEQDPYTFLMLAHAETERLRRRAAGDLYPDPEEVESAAALEVVAEAAEVMLKDEGDGIKVDSFMLESKGKIVSVDEDVATTLSVDLRDLETVQHYTIKEALLKFDDNADVGLSSPASRSETVAYYLSRREGRVTGKVIFWKAPSVDPDKLLTPAVLLDLARQLSPDPEQLIDRSRNAL